MINIIYFVYGALVAIIGDEYNISNWIQIPTCILGAIMLSFLSKRKTICKE